MTLSMPDSVDVAALPPGYGQYLGYVDGKWPTWAALRRRFPDARIIALTVTGQTLDAQGCDIETGDLTEDQGAAWARQKLDRDPGSRPVLYASISRMGIVRDRLVVHQVPRTSVRLLSAHWGAGEHTCGPATCGQVAIPMDGTQWTDRFPSGPRLVDMSVLEDSFFGSWTEEIVQQLPVVRQGDNGEAVRTVQGALLARGVPIGDTGQFDDGIDGVFGEVTKNGVIFVQQHLGGFKGPDVDGVVGPQTWPVLLGIA